MKLTRRALASQAAGLSLLGGAAAPSAAQQAPAQPASADQELDAARARLRRSIDLVRSVKVPPATEPAFKFVP